MLTTSSGGEFREPAAAASGSGKHASCSTKSVTKWLKNSVLGIELGGFFVKFRFSIFFPVFQAANAQHVAAMAALEAIQSQQKQQQHVQQAQATAQQQVQARSQANSFSSPLFGRNSSENASNPGTK